LSAAAYLFFFPSLYIILTDKRRIKLLAFHAAQALLLWIMAALALVLLRSLLNLIWVLIYLPWLDFIASILRLGLFAYIFFCGIKALNGEKYEIPWISKAAEALC